MSTSLSSQKCVACEGDLAYRLKDDEIAKNLTYVKSWVLEGTAISKKFNFKGFSEAMSFVKKIADIAEAEGHHPDIFISYNKVTVTLTTHALKGLSLNDFIIASKIDDLQA